MKDSVRALLIGKLITSSQIGIVGIKADHSREVNNTGIPIYTNVTLDVVLHGLTWEEYQLLQSEFKR